MVKISGGLVPVTCIWSSIFSSTFIVLALKRVNLPQKINCQSVSILSNKSHLFLSPLHSFIVTRFWEISPLLQNCNSLPFFKSIIQCMAKILNLLWRFFRCWANVHFCKWQTIDELQINLVTLRDSFLWTMNLSTFLHFPANAKFINEIN